MVAIDCVKDRLGFQLSSMKTRLNVQSGLCNLGRQHHEAQRAQFYVISETEKVNLGSIECSTSYDNGSVQVFRHVYICLL